MKDGPDKRPAEDGGEKPQSGKQRKKLERRRKKEQGEEEEDAQEDFSTAEAREGQDQHQQVNYGPIVTKGYRNWGATEARSSNWHTQSHNGNSQDGGGGGAKGGRGRGSQQQKGTPAKGRGKTHKEKDEDEGGEEGDKGKGKGKGKHNRRRKRRTNPGMVPQQLQTRDRGHLYILSTQTRAILQLQSEMRVIRGVNLTTIIGPIDKSPFAEALVAKEAHAMAVAEERQKVKDQLIEHSKGVGPSIPAMFLDFVTALAAVEGLSFAHSSSLHDYAAEINSLDELEQAPTLLQTCSHFSVHPILSDPERIRFQFAITAGDVKNAIINGMSNLGDHISVSSGQAQPGFFEEELTDWLAVLHI